MQIPFRSSSLTADFYFAQTTATPANRSESVSPVSQATTVPPVTNPSAPTTIAASMSQKETMLQVAAAKTRKIKGLRGGRTVWHILGATLAGLGTTAVVANIVYYNESKELVSQYGYGYSYEVPFPWVSVLVDTATIAGGVWLVAKPHYKARINTLQREADQLKSQANTLSFTPVIRRGGQGLTFGGTLRYSF